MKMSFQMSKYKIEKSSNCIFARRDEKYSYYGYLTNTRLSANSVSLEKFSFCFNLLQEN